MPITREQFSRRQTLDLETAMARTLAGFLKEQVFTVGGGVRRLQEVYEEWASFDDGDLVPSACVLPDGEISYAPGQNTPTLMEETWENRGEPGFGLYKLSEGTRPFEVVVRAASGPERSAIKAGIESLFVDGRLLMRPGTDRYGILLPLPEYFGVTARYTLTASRKLDGADNAKANIQEAQFSIRCEAPHVAVGPVRPFTYRIVAEVGEGPIP